jgi:UDP-glucose 4-epimerase
VFLSSAAVYGAPRQQPITEEHPLAPASPYGHHKKLCEAVCAEFTQIFSVRTACLRIFSAYGPGLRRQVVWDICAKAVHESEVVLQGTGTESRDFIHAQDVASAVHLVACTAPMQGEVYNVASGQDIRIETVARHLLERLAPGKRLRVTGVLPPGTPRQWRADIGRLRQLGFAPQVPFEQGLNDVVTWYQQEVGSECRKKSA